MCSKYELWLKENTKRKNTQLFLLEQYDDWRLFKLIVTNNVKSSNTYEYHSVSYHLWNVKTNVWKTYIHHKTAMINLIKLRGIKMSLLDKFKPINATNTSPLYEVYNITQQQYEIVKNIYDKYSKIYDMYFSLIQQLDIYLEENVDKEYINENAELIKEKYNTSDYNVRLSQWYYISASLSGVNDVLWYILKSNIIPDVYKTHYPDRTCICGSNRRSEKFTLNEILNQLNVLGWWL